MNTIDPVWYFILYLFVGLTFILSRWRTEIALMLYELLLRIERQLEEAEEEEARKQRSAKEEKNDSKKS